MSAFDNTVLVATTGAIINNTNDFITGYVCDMIDNDTYLTEEQKTESKNNFLANPPKNNPMFYKLTQNTVDSLFTTIKSEFTNKAYVTVAGSNYYVKFT